MVTAEEIFEDVRLNNDIPERYTNILEINCFMSLRILMKQFQNNHISKELATREKKKIFKIYENNVKEYQFKKNMFDKHIDNIKRTGQVRCLLRHQLNEQSEYSLDTALKLIELYSHEDWRFKNE